MMSIFLTILASGIAFDITLNDGDAISNIFKAIGTIFHKAEPEISVVKTEKMMMIERLNSEINDLYEELDYNDTTPDEINIIKEQINYKKQLIEKLIKKDEN